MSTLHNIRDGITRAWDSLTEGWREFRELAGDALTRFYPGKSHADGDSPEARAVSRASRWGLLAAEVTDDADHVHVMLEAPGLEAGDLQINIVDDMLVVSGEKKVVRETSNRHYHLMERAYGHFERAIRLPAAVEDEGATATYRSGVLTITLQKSRTARPRRIAVKVE